jgi:hypothetical protein
MTLLNNLPETNRRVTFRSVRDGNSDVMLNARACIFSGGRSANRSLNRIACV